MSVKNHGAYLDHVRCWHTFTPCGWLKYVLNLLQAHKSSNGHECDAQSCFSCSTRTRYEYYIVSAAPPILLDNLKRLSTPVIIFFEGKGCKKAETGQATACAQHTPGYHKHTAHTFAREEKHNKSEPGAFTRDEPASSLPKENEFNERRAGASKSSRTFAFLVFFPSAEKKTSRQWI